MSDLEFVPVDPTDPASFDPWYAVYLAAQQHDRGEHGTPWQADELRAQLAQPGSGTWIEGWLGTADGEPVVSGTVFGSRDHNTHRLVIYVETAPAQRRRGYGSAMLEHLERIAVEDRRTTLVAEMHWPYELGPSGAGAPGREFAVRHGYELALGDVLRVLRLPVPDETLQRLAAEAAPHHRDYQLRTFASPVPEDIVAQWAALSALLMTEAPTGELDLEVEPGDVERFREHEDLMVRQGRRKLHTAAFDAAGELVAYTDFSLPDAEPERAYQWGTLVRRADRGHRLGIAVKVANLIRLQQDRPGTRFVYTGNAETNTHMVAVNDALGFEPVERLGEMQKKLR